MIFLTEPINTALNIYTTRLYIYVCRYVRIRVQCCSEDLRGPTEPPIFFLRWFQNMQRFYVVLPLFCVQNSWPFWFFFFVCQPNNGCRINNWTSKTQFEGGNPAFSLPSRHYCFPTHTGVKLIYLIKLK